MRTIRAIIMPVLLLAAVTALAWLELEVTNISHFDFIWDVLLGAVLGISLALLAPLSGFVPGRNTMTSMFWVCGFASLLLIFYQYMTLVTGMEIEMLQFVSAPSARMRIVEGTMLGYCSLVAGRGKI